jgi:hypothetical protein
VRFSLALVLLFGGCYDDSAFWALQQAGEGDSSSTSASSEPTSSSAGPLSTGTGGSTSSDTTAEATGTGTAAGSSTGDTAADAPGPTVTLEVDPPVLELAGPVDLLVEHSLDADHFELWDAVDDEAPRLTWLSGESPPSYVITQGAPGSLRSLTVRAYDSEGNAGDSNVATVELQLPGSGTPLWETEIDLGNVTEARALTSASLAGDVRIFAGFHTDGTALAGRFTSTGDAQFNVAVQPPLSISTGVALADDGWLLVAGGELINNKTRGWVARVDTGQGTVDKIFTANLGDSVTGLAYDRVADRIYLSGYAPGLGGPAPDARIWAISGEGDLLWTKSWERPVDEDNDVGEPVDRGLGVALLDDGDPVLVGSTEFTPAGDTTQYWAFVLRYSPDSTLTDAMTWVSEESVKHAGASAVAADDDNGLLVAGWTSTDIAERQATVWAFDALLKPAEIYSQGPAGDWRSVAVARLRTGEIVNVVNVDIEDDDRHDFEVRALTSGFGALWTQPFPAEISRGAALTVTPHGHIVAAGTRFVAGEWRMLLAGIHP